MIALAAAILIGALAPGPGAPAPPAAAQAGAVQRQLSYTRDFEREADRVGFQTLAGAGFDVHAHAVRSSRRCSARRASPTTAPCRATCAPTR